MSTTGSEAALEKAPVIGGCLRLPGEVDAGRLAKEVLAIPDEAWVSRANRLGVHRAAGAVFLRGYAPAEGEKPIEGRPILARLPYSRTLIDGLGAYPQRALLARLPGGAVIPPHTDVGAYFDRTIRIHIPVVTHPRVWMVCDGLTYTMAAGEIWVLDNSLRHAVWNAHPTKERIHLICDFLSDPSLLSLLQRGERGLGRVAAHVDEEISARAARRAVKA